MNPPLQKPTMNPPKFFLYAPDYAYDIPDNVIDL